MLARSMSFSALLTLLLTVGRFLLGIATFQLVLATAHYIMTLLDLIGGFLIHVDEPGGSDVYFAYPGHPVYIAELFFYFTNVRTEFITRILSFI